MRTLGFMFFFAAHVLISSLSYAQVMENMSTVENFAGEWKWETEDECLIFYLRDTIWKASELGTEKHSIVGTYKYYKNGALIVDNTGRDTIPWYMPIYASKSKVDSDGFIRELRLLFKDTVTGKESCADYSTLTYSMGRFSTELYVYLADERKWYDGIEDEIARTPEEAAHLKQLSSAAKLPGWSIPNDVTLTKVN